MLQDIRHAGLVALGGAIGAVIRFAISLGVGRMVGPRGVPAATLGINLLGSFVIGYLAVSLASPDAGGSKSRLFWMTGVLGGFTTFSAFSLETNTMLDDGRRGLALAYVAASVVGCIASAAVGMRLAR